MHLNPQTRSVSKQTSSATRLAWIDCAKGLGILGVVLLHTINGLKASGLMGLVPAWEFCDHALYLFVVPVFFFVAGLFADRSYEKYGFREFLKSKVSALAYPYVVWQTIQILIMLASGAANRKPTPDMLLWFPLFPYMQFWFLYCLILVIGLYSLLKLAKVPSWAIAAISVGMLFIPEASWRPFTELCMYMVYFGCGLLLQGKMDRPARASAKWLLPAAIACFGGVAVLVWYGLTIDSPYRVIGGIPGVAGVCLLSMAMIRLPLASVFCTLGRASLEIFVAHTVFAAGMRFVLLKLVHTENLAIHIVLGIAISIAGPLAILMLQRAPGRFRVPLFRARLSEG